MFLNFYHYVKNEEGYVSHFSDFANLNSVYIFSPIHLAWLDLCELSQ